MIDLHRENKKKIWKDLVPSTGYLVVIGFFVANYVLSLVGFAKFLNYLFPASALLCGAYLYQKHSRVYIVFTWLIWFISPLFRRIIDYKTGTFTDPSPIILTPYLIGILMLERPLKSISLKGATGHIPFFIVLISISYAYVIGILNSSIKDASPDMLEWLIPVLTGYYLFVNWRNYPQYAEDLRTVFLWSALVFGGYGIYQYLVAPDWDTFWMISLGDRGSTFGWPKPFEIRVWSTMGGPVIFAMEMASALLISVNSLGPVAFIGSCVGFLSLLLSLVRAAWLGFTVGFLSLVITLKPRMQIRMLFVVSILIAILIPITGMEQYSSVITGRLETLMDPTSDGSSQVRQGIYQNSLEFVTTNFVGTGIGGDHLQLGFDSAVLEILVGFGWIGSIAYILGIFLIIYKVFSDETYYLDKFSASFRAVIVMNLSCAFLVPINRGLPATILWSFLGISLASINYRKAIQKSA